MHDLINEEEFYIKEYNPWKGFIFFYIINIIFYITASIIIRMTYDVTIRKPLGYVCGLLVIISPFILIFRNKKNIFATQVTLISAVIIHTIIYAALLLGEQHLKDFNYGVPFHPLPARIYLQVLCALFAYGLFCSGIMLFIRWRKLKKRLVKPQSSSL